MGPWKRNEPSPVPTQAIPTQTWLDRMMIKVPPITKAKVVIEFTG
jgi:hypothetical protein